MKKLLGVVLISLATTSVIAQQAVTKIHASTLNQPHEWQLTAIDDHRYFMLGPDLNHSKVEVFLNKQLEDGGVPDAIRLTCADEVIYIHPGETGRCELFFNGTIAMNIPVFKSGAVGTYTFK